MSEGFLKLALFLAYGPLALMVAVYGAALVLRCCGRPDLLQVLVKRTSEQPPVPRGHDHGH